MGYFKSGMSEYDSTHVYVPLEQLQKSRLLLQPDGNGAVNQIQVKLRPGVRIDEIAERPGTVIPPDVPIDDLEPLTPPVDVEFRVAAMGLAWDGTAQAVVVEAVAATDEPIEEDVILSDSDEGPDALRVTTTPAAARAFVARARRVIAAGRPSCPLCSLPLDPTGHVCPRQNGYRR